MSESEIKGRPRLLPEIIEVLSSQMGRYQIIFLAPLFIMVLLSGLYVMPELGVIRAIAPFLILVCLFITVLKNPNRLLVTFGVVLAFLGTSVIYDGILFVVEQIEATTVS